MIAARATLEKQAEDVVVLDLRPLSAVTDFFVICTTGSARQADAVREHLEATLSQHGASVGHTEGRPGPVGPGNSGLQWVLLDCGDVVVHLLDQRSRDFYRLERLWGDAPQLPLP